MKKIASVWKSGMAVLVGAAMVSGIVTLCASSALAGPGLDCGPTYQWICETPGCPDCPIYLFEGTVCEKGVYEKKTGRVCHVE